LSQRPVFLLSVPRAGSTLVQRVLAAHPEVATAPEPWLLIPQIYAMRERGVLAEYAHVTAARAIREFATRLPRGDTDYATELRRFILSLYRRASGGEVTYFVDKTPRYHLIAEELFEIFPDARWIFLWRNPLAVAASMVVTWARGRWRLDRWRVDLLDGPRNLVSAYQGHAHAAFAVRYEELISEPTTTWPRLFEYLELDFEPALLDALPSIQLPARMGDRIGSSRYSELSAEPLHKWKAVVDSPIRKRWCRRYLWHLGSEVLQVMGYDLQSLLQEVGAIPTNRRRIASDTANSAYAWALRMGQRSTMQLFGPRRTLWPGRWPS
jgi:hypothetical protein